MKYILTFLLLISGYALARDTIVRCSSRDHHRQNCYADTSGGVELYRQLSRASCHDNWGYSHEGIWVDNGCRAKFRLFVNNHGSRYNDNRHNQGGYNSNHNNQGGYNSNHNNQPINNGHNQANNNGYSQPAYNDNHHSKSGHINIINQTNDDIKVSCGHDGNQGYTDHIESNYSYNLDVTADSHNVVRCNAYDHHGQIISSNTFDLHHNGQSHTWRVNNHH